MEGDEDDLYADSFAAGDPSWKDDPADAEPPRPAPARPSMGSGSKSKKPAAGSQPPKVQIACLYCRHRRIRCDGNTPCSSCVQRGKECQYPTEPPKKRAYWATATRCLCGLLLPPRPCSTLCFAVCVCVCRRPQGQEA